MAGALPPLRDDLALMTGPAAQDGSPTWMLHDPQSNRFFRLDWPAFEILSRWHLADPRAVADRIASETTAPVDVADVLGLVQVLARGQLLKAATPRDVARLLSLDAAARTSWSEWLVHHYLFFRIPLARPDAWLQGALPFVAWMGTRAFRLATLIALALGLVLALRQWDAFEATFVDYFSFPGLLAFGLALGLAKIAHELGHAFTAKAMGCRVPTMGVAFLVLWPMPYTDVNEAWRLSDRRGRLLVGGAGILTELGIAAWATLAWSLLPDGTARSMVFVLATSTWISSLAVNLSPFMRFDGYFLLMDGLDQPNLHQRSFALARWHLRETLFGLGEGPPEQPPPSTRHFMIAFAWAVWLYRVVLFLGIAVLVYHFFIKAVGIVLFGIEIGWFLARPLWNEFAEWRERMPAIRTSRRTGWSLGLLTLVVLFLVLPWSGRVAAPALLKAERYVALYAPMSAMLGEISAAEGDAVAAGAILVRLENPDSVHRLRQVAHRIEVLEYELAATGFDEGFRARGQSIAEELSAALAERAALAAELERLVLAAPIAGTVADLSPDLQPGQWINPRQPILGIRNGIQIEAYVAEADVSRIGLGAGAVFIPEGTAGTVSAKVTAIDPAAVKSLTEPSLAERFGGDIPARFAGKALVPDGAFFRVRLDVPDVSHPAAPLRGQVHIDGARRSLLGRALRVAAAILIREWGT